MATKEKIKKKKPKGGKTQVIPLEDKNPPVIVSGAEDENTVDTTFQGVTGKDRPASPVRYKKGQKKRDKSVDKKQGKVETKKKEKAENDEPLKEKGSQETDNDSVKEKPSSRPGTPASRPVSPESRPGTPGSVTSQKIRRSPSPFGKNTVEPVPQDSNSNMGSMLSVKSTTSVREAWSDNGSFTGAKQRPSSAKSTSTVVSRIDKNGKELDGDTLSLRTKLGQEIEGPEQNAYIPYVYAKKAIAHIMDDMKNMKMNHVRIVNDVDKHFRAIEDETQTQFNTFVLCLREQYSGKVKTFRQVIDIHRVELTKKEVYWNELLRSLTERNNRLLKDKKVLLIRNKVEIDRLEKEKTEVTDHFTHMLDKANGAAVTAEKDHEEKLAELKSENSVLLVDIETLKNERTKEVDTSSEVPVVAAAAVVIAAVAGTTTTNIQVAEAQTQTDGEGKQTVIFSAVVSTGDRKQQEQEKVHIDSERHDMTSERRQMEEERERIEDERKSWVAEISKLQAQLTQVTKDRAEWEGKYDILKHQAEDAATLHKKYTILENQYNALSAIVAATEESKTAAEENSKQSREEKDMITAEKVRLEAEIKKFEAAFKKKNGHLPSEEEKSDSAKEMYTQLEEVDTMVSSLDKKIETLEHVKSGTVLPPPDVLPAPVIIKNPEVNTVEVKVPDPSVVAALEKAQQELSALQTQLSDVCQEKSDLHIQISSLSSDLSENKGKVTELERLLAESAKGDGATGMATAASVAASAQSEEKVTELAAQLTEKDDELERLRQENREMQKDMKT